MSTVGGLMQSHWCSTMSALLFGEVRIYSLGFGSNCCFCDVQIHILWSPQVSARLSNKIKFLCEAQYCLCVWENSN